MVRNRVLAGALVLLLAGCQLPRTGGVGVVTPADVKTQNLPAGVEATLHGQVGAFPVPAGQALPSDVMNASTIALIDSSGQTQATTITDAQGNFNLPMGSYSPSTALPGPGLYYLEAIHGLGSAAPGNEVGRFRTVLQWTGTGWLSCTNGAINQAVVINQFTTALAIERGLDAAIPIANLINKVKTTTPIGLNAAPAVTGHSDAEINNLANDVLASLAANFDPVAKVPAINPTISSFQPTSAVANAMTVINGNGFSPATMGNTVTFNGTGTPATVLKASPTQLVVVVPNGATTGTVTVKTGRGQVTSASPFTVLASTGASGGLYIDTVSPLFGGPGTTLTLTGNFGNGSATPSIYFSTPAGWPAAQATASAWTSTTLTVSVPYGAQSGPLSMQIGAYSAVSADWFTYAPGELTFFDALSQSGPGYAYTTPWPMYGYATATASVGGRLYYYQIGGYNNDYNYVEVFPISPDTNNIQRPRPCSRLAIGRYQGTAAVVGNWLYAIGGQNSAGTFLQDVERAQILSDGSLGPWQSQGNLLQTARSHDAVVVRASTNVIYVLGGYNSTNSYLNTWEMFTVTPGTGAIVRSNTGTMYNNGASFTGAYGQAVLAGTGIFYQCGYVNGSYSTVTTTFPIQSDGTLGLGANQTATNWCHAYGILAMVGSEVYLINGYTSGVGYNNYVEHATLNLSTGVLTSGWTNSNTPATPNYQTYIYGPALVTPNNVIWITGGYSSETRILCGYVEADKSIKYWHWWGQTRRNWYGGLWLTIGRNIWRVAGYNGTNGTAESSTEYHGVDDDGTIGPAISGPALIAQRYGPGWIRTYDLATNYLYMIGGSSTTPAGNSQNVERIAINDSTGMLTGNWSYVASTASYTVSTYRKLQWASCLMINRYLYVIGGYDPAIGALRTIQRATINPDGTLSDFELLSTGLPWSCYESNIVRIKDWVYLIDGYWNGTSYPWVVRARVYPNGDLGNFFWDGTTTPTAMYGASINLFGNYLYMFGGASYAYGQRAPIKADGTFGSWSTYQPLGNNPMLGGATGLFISPLPTYKNYVYVMSGNGSGTNIQRATYR